MPLINREYYFDLSIDDYPTDTWNYDLLKNFNVINFINPESYWDELMDIIDATDADSIQLQKVEQRTMINDTNISSNNRKISVLQELNDNLVKTVLNASFRVFPPPSLLFTMLNLIHPMDIKVIILGQDPYPQTFRASNGRICPFSMGVATSIPKDAAYIPGALANIFDNMIKFGHLSGKPNHGNISRWAEQGVFMINTAFTVEENKSGSHDIIWKKFSYLLLKYVLDLHKKDLIILAWGAAANAMCKDINVNMSDHHIITSSHPSRRSAANPMLGYKYNTNETETMEKTSYPAFNSIDHFGLVNIQLEVKGKGKIEWGKPWIPGVGVINDTVQPIQTTKTIVDPSNYQTKPRTPKITQKKVTVTAVKSNVFVDPLNSNFNTNQL